MTLNSKSQRTMQEVTQIQVQEDDSPTLGPQFQEWKLNLQSTLQFF